MHRKDRYVIMSVSEIKKEQLIYSELQMAVMIDFEEIIKHEVEIVIYYRKAS